MRLVSWWLRKVAGDALARDIVGDVAESGGGAWRLAFIATEITIRSTRFRVAPTLNDFRYSVRSLKRAPWYAITTISVIALSMALATTVFAVVDGVLFKPLPYPNVSELYAVRGGWRAASNSGTTTVSLSDVTAWKSAVPEAEFALAVIGDRASIYGDPARSASVNAGFFDVLGQPLLMGGFRPQDFAPRPRGAGGVLPVVLSYDHWQRRFGGDPAILGRVFYGDDGAVSEVVGVTSRTFLFPMAVNGRLIPEAFTPLAMPADPANDRGRGLIAIARIPPGRTLTELNSRVQAAEAALALRFPKAPGARGFGPFDTATVTPIDTMMRAYQTRTFAIVFLTAVMLVLLACLNVTGLAAARTQDRVHELTLRRALGGRGTDLVHLLGAESAIVVLAGGVIGLIAAKCLLLVVADYLPPEIVLLKPAIIDLRVATFAMIAAAVSVGVTTMWPARAILRQEVMSGGGSRSTRRQGHVGRFVLIGTEVALALVMAVGGALLAGSLARLWREDAGFQVDRVLSFQIGAKSDPSFPEVDALLADVRRIPGVTQAGGSTMQLLQRAYKGSGFDEPAGSTAKTDIESIGVTGGFFETTALRPLAGRLPTDTELVTGAPVAVVSEQVARDFWHGEPALGRQLLRKGVPFAVIGVVRETRNVALDIDPIGAIYYPIAADTRPYFNNLFVQTAEGQGGEVLRAVSSLIDLQHTKFRVRTAVTMTSALGGSIRVRSFQTMLFASFGVAAVLIVGVGVLGLVAMVTSRRTREVGVRMALGARPSQIAALIVRQELAAVLAGLVAGALVSFWSATLVRSYLYKVDAYDSRIWLVAIAVLLSTSAAGAFLPARRASKVDPVKALRVE